MALKRHKSIPAKYAALMWKIETSNRSSHWFAHSHFMGKHIHPCRFQNKCTRKRGKKEPFPFKAWIISCEKARLAKSRQSKLWIRITLIWNVRVNVAKVYAGRFCLTFFKSVHHHLCLAVYPQSNHSTLKHYGFDYCNIIVTFNLNIYAFP